ncbi:MAG TPA: peroxiredoxin-like family protein [Pseudonocardiaceae bacterium]|nr:peroxiredoxin-like family protein [Pseudonocardiaceae bacterium]
MSENHEQEWVEKLPEGPFDLTKELARWRELRDVVMPADVVARMDRATTELAASQILTQVVAVGGRAPSFVLPNAVGKEVSLDRLLARGPVVISFYRGVWCPFCNLEQRALQQALPQITALGASLVAISGMTPDNSMSMVERLGLTYEVLTDAGLLVARRYGLVFELPEYLRQAYFRMGHPIPQFNGTTEHTLPIPATLVVDTGGIIRFAYANPNYMHRADPADVLAALAALGGVVG